MGRTSECSVEISFKKNFVFRSCELCLSQVSFRENLGLRGIPPPSHPLKALTGTGSAKMLCKILSPKGLEVKILKTKGLRPLSRWLLVPPPP